MRVSRAALLAALLMAPGLARAQNGSISGTVSNNVSGQTVAGATVSVVGTGKSAQADGVGHYRLADLAPGRITIEVIRVGYTSLRREVDLGPGQELRLDLTLSE